MNETNSHDYSLDAARALYRSLVRAALSWNVDPAMATHNPVFMRDGFLNYIDHSSAWEDTYWFLRDTGVLKEGFNGAHRLTVPLDKIDSAADAAFNTGISTDRIVEVLVGLLVDGYKSISFPSATFPSILISSPRATSINHPDEADEMASIFENLQILGYVRATQTKEGQPGFQWAPDAISILKRLHLA